MKRRRLLPWTIVASFLLHGVAYASLGRAPAVGRPEHRKTLVRFEVATPPTPPPPPAAEEPKPEPPKPKPRAPEPKAAPPPEAAPPPPAAPEPPVSEGVTLAGDGTGNAFSMPLGNGGALEPTRPRAPAPVNEPAPVKPAPSPRVTEPPVVAVGDLSSRPSPPSLGAALERNYPADARQRGLSGSAKVRARIDPDGVVRRVTLVEESGAGFGAACSRTLNGSRWAAPKDKAGRSVATEIRYTCRFVVQP
ncbi:MAG TPA: TonB family protein [Polyangiaceae bacterium]|nr:TonB family protein [Polyangiaceae bacterium]